jgi:hypothetical protein
VFLNESCVCPCTVYDNFDVGDPVVIQNLFMSVDQLTRGSCTLARQQVHYFTSSPAARKGCPLAGSPAARCQYSSTGRRTQNINFFLRKESPLLMAPSGPTRPARRAAPCCRARRAAPCPCHSRCCRYVYCDNTTIDFPSNSNARRQRALFSQLLPQKKRLTR